MRFLFLGDLVGRSGRKAVVDQLPGLRRDFNLDFVVVNGENAAGGFGITEQIFNDLIDAGADAVTLGNHAFDQRDTLCTSIATTNSSGRLIFQRKRQAKVLAFFARRTARMYW